MPVKEGFKTLYKARYSAQGTLANEVLPKQADIVLSMIPALENKDPTVIPYIIGWLSANIPIYKKFFPNYEALQKDLSDIRELRDKWIRDNGMRYFPNTIYMMVYRLYEQFWEAYNESGAGLGSQVYVSEDQRNREAMARL